MKNKKRLFPVALSALLHIFIVLCKYKEGRRRALYSCQLICALVGRPRQPHEKHVNTSLHHETSFENKAGGALAWVQAEQHLRFHREHCASHQEMSNYFTHNRTSVEEVMGKQRLPFLYLHQTVKEQRR